MHAAANMHWGSPERMVPCTMAASWHRLAPAAVLWLLLRGLGSHGVGRTLSTARHWLVLPSNCRVQQPILRKDSLGFGRSRRHYRHARGSSADTTRVSTDSSPPMSRQGRAGSSVTPRQVRTAQPTRALHDVRTTLLHRAAAWESLLCYRGGCRGKQTAGTCTHNFTLLP